MSSKWFVTPSLRVATFSHYNKMGEDVLVETDLKTKLCRHGELSSSIRTWVQIEAKARAEGAEPFKRPSTCNCIVTHGLQLMRLVMHWLINWMRWVEWTLRH